MRIRGQLGIQYIVGLAIVLLTGYAATTQLAASAQDAPASLTVNVYTCDDLHDPIDPKQTLVNECAIGTEDIAFTLEPITPNSGGMAASTGTGGSPATISFTELTPGDYRLSLPPSDAIALSYVAQCTSSVRTIDTPFSPLAIIEPGGRLNVQLLPGEQLTCDWYNVLAPQQPAATTLTVEVYSCSGDVIDPAVCDPAPNIELRLFGPSADIIITSDANGIATFGGTGIFQLEPVTTLPDRDFCALLPPANSPDGSFTLDPATPITLQAYYCYPGA